MSDKLEGRDSNGRWKKGTTPGKDYMWKPGQCGNPKRKGYISLRRRLVKAFNEIIDEDGTTAGDIFIQKMIELAPDIAKEKGAIDLIKIIVDLHDGLPNSTTNVKLSTSAPADYEYAEKEANRILAAYKSDSRN